MANPDYRGKDGQPAIYKSALPTLTDGDAVGLQVDVNGNLKTTAQLTAESIVVETGGVYNASAPTLTNTQQSELQLDVNGNLKETLATLGAGENLTTNRLNNEPIYSFLNIVLAAPTTTIVKSGAGTLHAITFNKPVATGTVTIFDNTAGSGTSMGIITTPASPMPVTLIYDLSFSTGLTLVTATAAQDICVTYR